MESCRRALPGKSNLGLTSPISHFQPRCQQLWILSDCECIIELSVCVVSFFFWLLVVLQLKFNLIGKIHNLLGNVLISLYWNLAPGVLRIHLKCVADHSWENFYFAMKVVNYYCHPFMTINNVTCRLYDFLDCIVACSCCKLASTSIARAPLVIWTMHPSRISVFCRHQLVSAPSTQSAQQRILPPP